MIGANKISIVKYQYQESTSDLIKLNYTLLLYEMDGVFTI